MKKTKTSSFFVNIIEDSKGKYIRRKKRKGIKPYARTLSYRKIKRILSNSNILYPKILKVHFNCVDEEYIEPTKDINSIPKNEINDYFINLITSLNSVNIKKYKNYVSWKNNTEFIKFQINNFYNAMKISDNTDKLNEAKRRFESININMDDNRKMSLIHGDLHLNNLIVNNDKIYLIDFEMATIGDLAYELAIHFILMNYTEKEEMNFIDKILLTINCDKEKLIHDINEYRKFEFIRREILHGNIDNHNH